MRNRSIEARLRRARQRTAALRRVLGLEGIALRWDGSTLRLCRRAARVTQRGLAKTLGNGIEQPHVSRWEHGQAPTATTLKRIVRALGCDARELLGGT
jgi:predicted transcriptional regulator